MSQLTLAASGVRALLDMAVARGANRLRLLELAGIDQADLEDRDTRVAFDKYVALMKAAQQLCNDPALALHFGESVDTSEISFLHPIGASSLTEAFAVMNRYARITVEVEGEGDRYVMKRIGGQLWMLDTRRNPNDFPELTESGFARMICSGRRMLGDHKYLKAVHVTHPAPSYRAEYERIFRVPVVFESDKNGFLIDDSMLSFKPPIMAGYASEVLREHADDLLEKLEQSKSIRAKVERVLTQGFKTGDVSMKNVATQLGVSRQTLFRRLKSENVTFEKVLDELRQKMALDYLNGRKMSVSQTAHLLGFSDPAAFSRAFKRWTGSPPRAAISSR